MIQYALHLRYMSLQAYRLLFEKSPMLFLSLLNNIQQGVVVAFLVVELKQSIPFVVQTIPEVTLNGQWLAEKISDTLTVS